MPGFVPQISEYEEEEIITNADHLVLNFFEG